MLLFVFIALGFAIGWGFFYYFTREKSCGLGDMFSFFFAVGFTTALILSPFLAFRSDNTFSDFFKKYNETKYEVSLLMNSSQEIDPAFYNKVYKNVKEINMTICEHKMYHNSIWVSLWFNSEIAELKPMEFNMSIRGK